MSHEELPDEAWEIYLDDRQRKRYQAALALHPHPADPDHPELEDDDE